MVKLKGKKTINTKLIEITNQNIILQLQMNTIYSLKLSYLK